jgi:SHS2 domain-containing protein
MRYRFLEDIAIADAAFEAEGQTLEEVFQAAADATLNVMVEDLESVRPRARREVRLEADAVDLLLFELLQEIVYRKDAERLLMRVRDVRIGTEGGRHTLTADAQGEEIDPGRHTLLADVKAITLHRFSVEQTPSGWKATVVVDV